MTKITFTTPDGATLQVEGKVGLSIMEVATQNDIPGIVAECGGACACATCHVYLDAETGERSRVEEDMLDFVAAERRPTSRLSCQVKVSEALGDVHVEIPHSQ